MVGCESYMDFKLKNPKTPSIKSIFERVEIENGCYFENSGTTPNVLPLDFVCLLNIWEKIG